MQILLQFWGRYNCCDEKCTLHILYSKAAFSITPLTISLDRNASILELWNWSLTKSFALYFEAMHQGSRHLRIQDVPLVHISLGSGIGSTYFGELCLVLRYFEELVLRCSCGCTGHRMHQASSRAAALTLSALVLLTAGLALWEGCPSPLSCCPFFWSKYFDVNVALLEKEGSEPRKEAAKVLTAASHDIYIILFWLELLLQLWVPHCTGWLLSANANVR